MEKWIELIKQKFWDGIALIPENIRMGRYSIIVIILALFIFLIFLIRLFLFIYKKLKFEKELKGISLNVISAAQASVNSQKFIDQCLNMVCPMINAQSYGFYLFDSKNELYALKSVKYLIEDLNEIGPSYSGLAPFEKEQYIQPVSVENRDIPDKTKKVTDGKVPILVIPMGDKKALIRVFPVKKISKKTINKLDYFAKIVGMTFDVISETDAVKNKINNIAVSDSAVNKIVNTLGTEDGLLFTLIGLCIKKTGADSGFFIKKQEEDLMPLCFISLSGDFETDILNDVEGLKNMFSLSTKSDLVNLSKNSPDYYTLPPYFTIYQIESVVFAKFEYSEITGSIVLLYKEGNNNQGLDIIKIKAVQYARNKFQEMFGVQNIMRSLSESFQGTLQGLMQLIDNIKPYTVGYSELMARFSYIIADELGLPDDEKKDVYLAAYLSNIGVLGLSNDIFFKTGKYSEIEYESMKFHAEAGAKIIEAALGSKRVADFVRYHHERIDGLGYPTGIKGNEIPQGARIISVVQFFLAKINGRKGRDPVSFYDALKSLKMCANTQLDKECVNALISWVNKKRNSLTNNEKSLGYCWEMRCSSFEICMDCPVYLKKDVNCWEYETNGIKCSEHGNTCKTCYIRTEVLGR
ncbi:MAG: HD domain-containing protein [Herbinix sp.]|nr:HD domain-containing protein [Herbinix sp.]